jgi:hypothetical protein
LNRRRQLAEYRDEFCRLKQVGWADERERDEDAAILSELQRERDNYELLMLIPLWVGTQATRPWGPRAIQSLTIVRLYQLLRKQLQHEKLRVGLNCKLGQPRIYEKVGVGAPYPFPERPRRGCGQLRRIVQIRPSCPVTK